MAIVYYSEKGAGLTASEIDNNFLELDTGKLSKDNGSVNVKTGGDVELGAVITPTSVSGFPYIPFTSSPPTETPANISADFVPMCFCSGDNKLYIYFGGAWIASAVFA